MNHSLDTVYKSRLPRNSTNGRILATMTTTLQLGLAYTMIYSVFQVSAPRIGLTPVAVSG